MERDPRGRGRDDFPIEPLEVIDPSVWQDQPIPVQRWLWRDWIPIGSTTMLAGEGGTGKSLLTQMLATACATGRPFLGHEVMRCKAMVLAGEDSRDELHRRQARINAALGIDMADLFGTLLLAPRAGAENALMTFGGDGIGRATPLFDQVATTARTRGVQLLVLDPLSLLFAGNENIRGEASQFVGLLTRLALAIDGAVLLLAHPSISGRTSGTGESGSTGWNAAVRSRLTFERLKSEDGGDLDPDLRVLSRRKANYAAAGADLTVRWKAGAFEVERGAAVDGQHTPERRALAEAAFLAGLAELGAKRFNSNIHRGQANFAPRALREKTTAAEAFTETELEGAMNRLIKSGRIESVTEGPKSRERSRLVIVQGDLPGLNAVKPQASP